MIKAQRARYAQEQRQAVIDAVEDARKAWESSLRRIVYQQAEVHLPHALARVRELKVRVDELAALLDAASLEVQRMREPAAAPGMSGHMVDDREIDTAFEQPARLDAMDLAARDRVRALLDAPRTVPGFTVAIREAAEHAVRTVAPEYLGRLSIPAEQIAHAVDRLAPLAVFTGDWAAHPDSQMLEALTLLGLPESMGSQTAEVRSLVPASSRSDVELITHQDEERVVITAQHHGFPLFALAEMAECRRAYADSDALTRALRFVFPEQSVRTWDIFPVEARDSRQYFALGLGLGQVRRAGTDYVYNNGQERALDVRLGGSPDPVQARQVARDEFLKGGFASEVRATLDTRVLREGNVPLYEMLGRWIEEQDRHAADPEYPAEFQIDVELVREFRKSIRPY
jgi:hypothetical protein